MQRNQKKLRSKKGFTLIEVLVGLSILVLVILSIYGIFRLALKSIGLSEARITASNLANQQMETIRNMAYDDLGTTEGWPTGNIPSSKVVTINKINYTIHTDIQYIDDPLDGVAPDDLYNADYKRVRVWVEWDKYPSKKPVVLITDVAPKGIESPVGGGTLSITVLNTKGEPVPTVSVHIENTNLSPAININTQTDAQGKLIVPALPADSGNNYAIKVTKDGYTSDYTSPISDALPNPLLPHQSIAEGGLTSVTFTIDLVSTLTIHTVDNKETPNWCDPAYYYRRQLTITNNSTQTAPAGLSVSYSFDHASLVSAGKSLTSGDDVRIFYWNGSTCQELDRFNTTEWNTPNTQIWFKTQQEIPSSSDDSSYYLYYGNPNATNPPADLTKIFNPPKDANTKGLYYFENGTGETLTDSSDNGNNGTIHGATWSDGKSGRSLLFQNTGTPQYVSISVPDNSSLDITDSITLEAWVYPQSTSGTQSIIDRNYGYALWIENGYANFGVFDQANGMISLRTTTPIPENTWTHIAGSYSHSAGVFKIYLNNSENNSKSAKVSQFVSSNNYDLRLGNGYIAGDLASQFQGKIDEVRISSIARSSFPYGLLPNLSVSSGDEKPYNAPNAIAGIPLYIVGERIIGYDENGTGIPRNKFENQITDSAGAVTLENIEWDNYTIQEQDPNYDLAEIDPPNPVTLNPNETKDVTLTLVPHADHTLHVTVKDAQGSPIAGASVRLYNTDLGFDSTLTTSDVGQVFFTPLSAATYNLEVTKTGYLDFTEEINVAGQTEKEVILSTTE